jgi:hypothetical protein
MASQKEPSKEIPNSKKKPSFFHSPRSISTIEYAILSLIVVAALLGMAIYFKQAFSSRWRGTVDDTFGHGRQYDPYATQEIDF